MKRIVTLVIVGSLVLAGLATAAGAHKTVTASAKTRRAVEHVIVARHLLLRAQANCQHVLLDAGHRSWAESYWPRHLSRQCMKVAANGVIVVHHVHAHWHYVTEGSAFDCPIAHMPTVVARDFGLCPK
jgi:hypothetical protein